MEDEISDYVVENCEDEEESKGESFNMIDAKAYLELQSDEAEMVEEQVQSLVVSSATFIPQDLPSQALSRPSHQALSSSDLDEDVISLTSGSQQDFGFIELSSSSLDSPSNKLKRNKKQPL
jgi:hypothetical protein